MTAPGHLSVVHVPEFPPPRGYVNGMIGDGRYLTIAGQIGWNAACELVETSLLGQFAQALDNVLSVVRAAGGEPSCVAQMTVYVTDMPAYRACLRDLGPVWKARFGRHYPAMALVGTTALVEPGALVEIVAVAILPALPLP